MDSEKSYYFISGLPRSGSTLLSSILKQNTEFYADIASPLEKITESTIDSITFDDSNFTVTENQRKNLLCGIFDGYYKHVDNPIVFDTSKNWTKKTSLLKTLFPYTKILCTVRDISSILNSFELILSKNPFYTKTLTENKNNVFERCDDMMNKNNGVIATALISLQEGYALNPEIIYFVEYENLCKSPDKTMREIYNFLEKPYYHHDFNNINYSNENFDRFCNLKDLHTVRKKIEYKPQKWIIPPEIVKKYQKFNMEFWKRPYIDSFEETNETNEKNIKYK